jgi:hypothetical protein
MTQQPSITNAHVAAALVRCQASWQINDHEIARSWQSLRCVLRHSVAASCHPDAGPSWYRPIVSKIPKRSSPQFEEQSQTNSTQVIRESVANDRTSEMCTHVRRTWFAKGALKENAGRLAERAKKRRPFACLGHGLRGGRWPGPRVERDGVRCYRGRALKRNVSSEKHRAGHGFGGAGPATNLGVGLSNLGTPLRASWFAAASQTECFSRKTANVAKN